MREGRYWEEEKNKLCRLCRNESETWKYAWEECRSWKQRKGESWQKACRRRGGRGRGMREVEQERNSRRREKEGVSE